MTLRQLRYSLRLTLDQFSKILGVNLSALCKYERGVSSTPLTVVKKVKEIYGVDLINTRTEADLLKDQIKSLKEQRNKLHFELCLERLHKHNLQKALKRCIQQCTNLLKEIENGK